MPFRCLKLRTMHEGTELLPTHEVGKGAVTNLAAERGKGSAIAAAFDRLRIDFETPE